VVVVASTCDLKAATIHHTFFCILCKPMQATQTHSAKSIASYSDALSCPVHLESETARLKTAVVHLQGAKDKLEEQIYSDFFRSPSADKLATIQDKLTQIVTKLQEHHKQDLLQVLKHYDAGKKNIQDKFEHFEKFCGLLRQRAHWAEFSHVFGNIGKTEKDNLSKYARQELMVAERVCLDDAQDYQIYALETCYSEMIDNEKQMVEHCQAWLHLCEERKNGALTTLMGTSFVYFSCNFIADACI
jgi:hypothetical protein